MKNILKVALISLLIPLASCSYKAYEKVIKSTISVDQAVQKKVELDSSTNPAEEYLKEQELKKKLVEVKNVVVKDVVPSSNIDYQFCVIVAVDTPKGVVECYIYSRDVTTIAKLKKGESRVRAIGDFGRFFTLLDETFTKIEVLDADIKILKK